MCVSCVVLLYLLHLGGCLVVVWLVVGFCGGGVFVVGGVRIGH